MCFWKMWNIHFWLDYITHFKQQKSFTLSWILLMEERYVVVLFPLYSVYSANSRWEEWNDSLQWAVIHILPILKILLLSAVATDFL